jgi:hypothetical protein
MALARWMQAGDNLSSTRISSSSPLVADLSWTVMKTELALRLKLVDSRLMMIDQTLPVGRSY